MNLKEKITKKIKASTILKRIEEAHNDRNVSILNFRDLEIIDPLIMCQLTAELKVALNFVNCVFCEDVSFDHTYMYKDIYFDKCQFRKSLNFSHSNWHSKYGLFMENSLIKGEFDLSDITAYKRTGQAVPFRLNIKYVQYYNDRVKLDRTDLLKLRYKYRFDMGAVGEKYNKQHPERKGK